MPRDTSDPLLPKQDNSVFDSIPRKVMPWSKTQLVAHSLDYWLLGYSGETRHNELEALLKEAE